MKKYFLFACTAAALVSCSSDDFLGENQGLTQRPADGSIMFTSANMKATRADSYGATAAALLGNNFIVEGTKGATAADATTTGLVFDNYLVVFEENTANSTESNTNNWEYVGKTEADGNLEADLFDNLNRGAKEQTIKYWDYSTDQYDFVAYSTGTKTMVNGTPASDDEVRVTLINKVNKGYTFEATSADALNQCYVSDIATVAKANYGAPVTLRFKNLGAKIRLGVFETIPGYSVRDVEFYADGTTNYKYVEETSPATKTVFAADAYDATPEIVYHAGDNFVTGTYYESDGTTELADPSKEVLAQKYYNADGATTHNVGDDVPAQVYNRLSNAVNTATLYGAAMPESGTVTVTYPVVGSDHTTEEAYNEPSVTVVAGSSTDTKKSFGTLANLRAGDDNETTPGQVFIGIASPSATFAGNVDLGYYQNVVPNPAGKALTLRCNYTLESIDGSGETIKVWGAQAVVPATYTQWQPNYAYTYLFKISDKTNGKTEGIEGTVEGLFPITFDAVVAEYTDVAGQQTTITTVATPSITTYQKGHVNTDASTEGEYDHSKGAIYVMVQDGSTLKNDLNSKGKLYTVTTTGAEISEATVNDALVMQKKEVSGTITGRNGVVLTPASPAADATITTVVGCDGKEIDVTAGEAASFTAAAAAKYAYVYTATAVANTYAKFQPVTKAVNDDVEGLYPLAYSAIEAVKNTNVTASVNAVGGKAYFAVSTVGGSTTYTYVSTVIGKPVADGLVWVDMSSAVASAAGDKAVANTFYFDKYTQNDGVYAVKVINVK